MAKKQYEATEFEYVTCQGCIFIHPYNDVNGHGFCKENHVKMVQVINADKPCIWKKTNG
jgi:hypothetical protein